MEAELRHVIPAQYLRRAMGILGMAFPLVLVIGSSCGGCSVLQPSISAYYHTLMGDFFVGFLCAFAMFLFAYSGYDKRDAVAGNLAGTFAIITALVPTAFDESIGCNEAAWFTCEAIHLTAAAAFFLVLTYFSLVLFRETKKGAKPSPEKLDRNKIYKWCGIIMLGCLVLIALYWLVLKKIWPGLETIKPVFWLESVALFVFGISWLIKGETFWQDNKTEVA